jgi:hypothetical protein
LFFLDFDFLIFLDRLFFLVRFFPPKDCADILLRSFVAFCLSIFLFAVAELSSFFLVSSGVRTDCFKEGLSFSRDLSNGLSKDTSWLKVGGGGALPVYTVNGTVALPGYPGKDTSRYS